MEAEIGKTGCEQGCVKRCVRKVKIHHLYADREIYAFCGNTAVDLDPLTVSRARLTVVEQALFERDVFEISICLSTQYNTQNE
jgi:hypothetical protein